MPGQQLPMGHEVEEVLPTGDFISLGDFALKRVNGETLVLQRVANGDVEGYLGRRRGELGLTGGEGDLAARLAAGGGDGGACGGSKADDDSRTLWVDWDDQGQRYKEWRLVVSESREASFGDSPIEGPSSCLHLMKHWLRHGGSPRLWLDIWCRSKGISNHERVYHELSLLLELFYVGGTYDQLNLPALCCFEVAARRIQSIVDAYAGDPSRPSWANARLYSGVGQAEDLVAPELRHYVARRAKEESDVESMRQRVRGLPSGAAAEAAKEGALPKAGEGAGQPKGRGRGRGRGQPPSPETT